MGSASEELLASADVSNVELDSQGGNITEYPSAQIRPEQVSRRLDMTIEIALDGQNFSAPCDTYFTYYGTPAITHIKTNFEAVEDKPVAIPGTEVSILGSGFFYDSDTLLTVYLTTQSGTPKIFIHGASCDSGVVKFTMPELQLGSSNTIRDASDLDHAHTGNEHKLNVNISFNGGENVTSSDISLIFLSPT